MTKYALLVVKNLFRSKRRTLLTIFSIAVSLFIFSALVSLPTVANQILADSASSVRVSCHNKAGLAYPMPESYRQRIAATPHVVAVVSEIWFGGIYHEVSDQFPNMAMDADQADAMWPDWGVTKEQFAEFKRLRTACLVGAGTMKRFHLRLGQQIALRGTAYPFNVTLTVVGVINRGAPPDVLFFRRDYLEEAAGRPGFVGNFWVRVDNSKNVPQVIAALDEGFANSSAETQSESEAAFIGGFMQNYRLFFQVAELLGLIVVLTIGLVAANTAAMSIRERRGEIAVMRSMGFTSRTILSLLLSESLLIGLAGGILGCGAAFVTLRVFAVEAGTMGPFGLISMPPRVLAAGLAVSALLGIASALVPAASAARRNIVDALRLVA
jgi:putative ABC transport system permease protein